MLWFGKDGLPDAVLQVVTLTKHLLQAFSADQLPAVYLVQEQVMQVLGGVQDPQFPSEQLRSSWFWGIMRDMYLEWVQATLLQVINDVLRGPQV
jgi:hypothetical protein